MTNPSPEGASVSFASFLIRIQRPQTNPSPEGASVSFASFLIRIQLETNQS